MTVDELLTRISSAELSEWMAYNAISPIGPQRADQRAALVASTLANINRAKGKQAYKLNDFMLYPEPKPKQSMDDLKRQLSKFAAMNKAYEAKRKKGGLGVQ